jgi:hypothetical protein
VIYEFERADGDSVLFSAADVKLVHEILETVPDDQFIKLKHAFAKYTYE